MSSASTDSDAMPGNVGEQPSFRERCYVCFRPKSSCFCDAIPSIRNRTQLLILQHVKERFHAFNTARIVKHSLQNCTLIVDQLPKLAAAALPLLKNTGVLYPDSTARLLSELSPQERPDQLVILDGTWHHARTMMRDLTVLHRLPRFRLEPTHPSNYRIRKEPTESALSTVEATIEALRALEPETKGFNQLLAAFRQMIDDQIDHPVRAARVRNRKQTPRTSINIPSVLIHDINNVVVAYGESSFGQKGARRNDQPLIYWVAQRLSSGATFECAISPQCPLTAEFHHHLELNADDFAEALSPDQFRTAWRTFIQPTDTLCVFNESTLHRLRKIGANFCPAVSLKSVNIGAKSCTLDDILDELNISPPQVPQKGRAGKRLANAIAFARFLNRIAPG